MLSPRLIGRIWPRNSKGKFLLIAQIADGPEILSYTDRPRLFDNLRAAARQADLPFPGDK